jgi:integrase
VIRHVAVNRFLSYLRAVINTAIEDNPRVVDSGNPVLPKLFAKENNERVRYLTDDEEPLLRAAIGEDEWPKVVFAESTGFRQGTQFRLRWTDVNFETGQIRARKPKANKDYYVPMNDELRATLGSLPSRLRSEYVFPSKTGKTPINPKNYVHRVFEPAVEQAGITDFHWHDLRHTFASRLVMKGVDLSTVQELMNHKTVTMTQRYSHLSPAHKLDAVQRLNPKPTATATATAKQPKQAAERDTAEVIDLPTKENEPCWIRTNDPLLKRQML